MQTALLAIGSAVFYIVAYNTYGRWLARKIFQLDPTRKTPSEEQEDGVDYVPSKPAIVFGHHFVSIAGTGPIVGPAIAVIWGWLPALLWTLLGSVFMGAVHDFGSLVVSLRNRGRSIADLCGSTINARVRALFHTIIFFEIWIVLAVFCLVIASVFSMYPSAVFPVWIQIPIAFVIGKIARKKGVSMTIPALIALFLMFVSIFIGVKYPELQPVFGGKTFSPVLIWTVILLAYCFIVSTLPVQTLLQPRDYVNALQLVALLALLFFGIIIVNPVIVAPAVQLKPQGAPSLFPFLFITIACGAISGFHSIVSSGVSSKQVSNEKHALPIGYGSMLLEGYLTVLVIIAVTAGIGIYYKTPKGGVLNGVAAWQTHFSSWGAADTLGKKVGGFVEGGANILQAFHIPRSFAVALLGVFVTSFASTTLDSATRLQRYVITEFGEAAGVNVLKNRYVATGIAVLTALILALWDIRCPEGWNFKGCGKGGLMLWPLFGAVNQLLGGLALMVVSVWLYRKKKPVWITLIPMIFMIVMTGWAMIVNIRDFYGTPGQIHLFWIGLIVFALEIWMILETLMIFFKPAIKAGA
ncbi:carbon starvation protein A [Candidatus Sumerlaeota bacterium]|nr:carbon starvation protein A [Candidatus Sumerlaeota bacterium]